MSPEKFPSLEELEIRVKSITSSKHKKEIVIMTNLMQCYIDGFNLMGSFTLTSDNEIQYAWMLLLAQSFRSMRCALLTMQIGYYGEALSLIRTGIEDLLAAEDCQKTPRTLSALLHDQNLKLNWGNIAENIGVKDKLYERDYKHLSRFTHVCKLSLAIIRDPETHELRSAPAYDEILFLDCCEMFNRNAVMMAEYMLNFLSKQSDTKKNEWLIKANSPIKEAGDWLKNLRTKYGYNNSTA